MEHKFISSNHNPLVKEVIKLQQKAAERKGSGLFVVEGVREVSLALKAGIGVEHLFFCEELFVEDPAYPVFLPNHTLPIVNVTVGVYAKMAYRGNAEGVMAVMHKFETSIENVEPSQPAMVVVLESVEKPGNLGAILRTADAAGADAVVICDSKSDIFNPNVIRSSLGCLFSLKVAVCHANEFFNWAEQHNLTTMIASVQASKTYYEADMTQGLALVFGTEADGLSSIWYEKAHEHLNIPMAGKIDSLNVSASAAIMTFEVVRQRKLFAHR